MGSGLPEQLSYSVHKTVYDTLQDGVEPNTFWAGHGSLSPSNNKETQRQIRAKEIHSPEIIKLKIGSHLGGVLTAHRASMLKGSQSMSNLNPNIAFSSGMPVVRNFITRNLKLKTVGQQANISSQ